jgi:glycosyltransferase involved in cell wall biosynthesis
VDLCVTSEPNDPNDPGYKRCRQQLARAGVSLLPYGWKPVARALASSEYDVGLFEFYWNAEKYAKTFRRLQPDTPIIVDSVDVHFARELLGVEVGVVDLGHAEKVRSRELSTYRSADAVIVVSEEDREILTAEGNLPPIFVVPNIIPIRRRPAESRSPEVLFVGGFRHQPNIDGVQWFAREIWPAIRNQVADARFTVVGSQPTAEVHELGKMSGVEVIGYVPDTNPHLDRAMVSVAPLRYGGGMKGKVNEAMASGVPVVTTSVGAQGLKALSGEHLVIADDPCRFADAVIELLRDPIRAEQLGNAGQRHTMKLCDPQQVEVALQEMLAELTAGNGAKPGAFLRYIYSSIFQGINVVTKLF